MFTLVLNIVGKRDAIGVGLVKTAPSSLLPAQTNFYPQKLHPIPGILGT
jgi:hypothetical protein